ncbi:MAG: hypothetical protein WCR83_06690 [Candidatus Methanomethylophilaceae archaeon]
MNQINQSANALKEMDGNSRSFNIVDQDGRSVSILCRITWEYSSTMGNTVKDEIENMMWELSDKISDLL